MFIRYEGLTFGGFSNPLIITSLEVPTFELRNSYSDRLGRDGVMLSKDYLSKGTWTFEVSTNGQDLQDTLDLAGELQRRWQNSKTRGSTAAVPMDYSHDGAKWFRVYGKPGSLGPVNPDALAHVGVGLVDAEFNQTDTRFFSGTEHLLTITAVPASVGGLTSPLVAPITTVASGAQRVGALHNEGDLPAPVSVRFYGPCTNPRVFTDKGYEIQYNGTVPWDGWVELDPRQMSVQDHRGIDRPGRLTRRSRLSSLVAPPGSSEWSYQATDETGTSYVELRYRDAYSSFQ